jgi:hypothetical protein
MVWYQVQQPEDSDYFVNSLQRYHLERILRARTMAIGSHGE